MEPFRYVTSDWLKVLIGVSLLFLYLIISIIVGAILSILLGSFSSIFTYMLYLIFEILLIGYYIGVIKNTLKGLDTLPSWTNLVKIVIDGLLYKIAYTIALLLYILVFIAPVILLGFMLILFFRDLSSHIPWIVLMSLLIIVAMIVYTVVMYIVFEICASLATVNFAKKGFFGFFKVLDILKKVSLEYLVIWVLYKIVPFIICIIIIIIGGIFLFILLLIPFINILVILSVIITGRVLEFILNIMFYRAVAKYYREKEEKDKK